MVPRPMLCAVQVPEPRQLQRASIVEKWDSSKNVFWQLLSAEGTSCFLQAQRRAHIRSQLHRHIRSSCGGYRGVVEGLVRNMVEVCEVLKARGEAVEVRKEILAMAVSLCQCYQLSYSVIVQYVITQHFLLSGAMVDWFEFLNPFGSLRRLRTSSLYPFKAERRGLIRHWCTKRHLAALEYYLSHGNQLAMYVSIKPTVMQANGVPLYIPTLFADFPLENYLFGTMTPLALACLIANPEAVLLLVRYGASCLHPYHPTSAPSQNWCQPLYVLVNQLNLRESDHYLQQVITSGTGRQTLRQLEASRAHRLLQCLAYLSRAVPKLPIKFCEKLTQQEEGEEAAISGGGGVSIEMKSQFEALLPSRCSSQPAELQHLCRCVIRHTMFAHQQVPTGICKLPLPATVKDYVDLKRDF